MHPDVSHTVPDSQATFSYTSFIPAAVSHIKDILHADHHPQPPDVEIPNSPSAPPHDALLVLLPLLVVLSTFLFLLLLFLVCVLLIRKRRGIILRDNEGPVDMSREELIDGEGGFEGVEARWLDSVSDVVRRAYQRARGLLLRSEHAPSLIAFIPRLPTSVSSQLSPNRHHAVPVPLYPGKGCFCLVF